MSLDVAGLTTGEKVIEGKTKIVYKLPQEPGHVLLISKDRITAGDGARANEMVGKATMSTHTASRVFELLNKCGMHTHFVRRVDDRSFVARHCEMIPIEWVARRIATGSFLKRYPGVPEGYRFHPVKVETFFKDDANHDPFFSSEQLVAARLKAGGLLLDAETVETLRRWTACVFEILERAWRNLGCTLVDMKIEFGVTLSEDSAPGSLVLADLIDNDSWRLWVGGDKQRMVDKQLYRDLPVDQLTPEALRKVAARFDWVAHRADFLLHGDSGHFVANATTESSAENQEPQHAVVEQGRVIVFLGSPTDRPVYEQIAKHLRQFGISSTCRVASAHKSTEYTLRVLAEYDGDLVPTVYIAVAGRSNGLGPVISGNTCSPVINCPPASNNVWDTEDVWSSLRLPSGLGCTTVLSPDVAALAAAQILSLNDHVLWGKLRVALFERARAITTADAASQV